MGLFFAYCRMHRKSGILFLVFCAVFAGIFALYGLPAAAVGYAAALCVFIGALVLAADFSLFRRRHLRLESLIGEITVTADRLPAPGNLLEADYQSVIRALDQDRRRSLDQLGGRYADLVEYYTLWAHQIKTPIAAMRLNLQSENGDSEQNQELYEQLQKIEQYVQMVLCYLRLDADSTDYVIRECDLDAILRQALRRYASQFIRRKIRLEYEPLNCRVLTDEKWLLFVVDQLLSNALKYTRPGGVISVTLKAPKTLCIRDTGIGIAPEDLPRIFEKGYTGYNGRSHQRSSGIGLYLCRRICGNLGHTLTAQSQVGAGTVLCLDLENASITVE
jgi:signal transduction histidine kinase